MVKVKKNEITPLIDFNFFTTLNYFYKTRKLKIKSKYKNLSKQFLNFNEENGFLRTPQLEALEMYVFIKEFLDNRDITEIFEDWANYRGVFEKREGADNKVNICLIYTSSKEEQEKIY